MLAVLSDTHGTDDHRLRDRTLQAVREAEVVVHAGDFTTGRVLDAFEAEADRLVAVHGNVDDPAVQSRLNATETVEYGGVRVAVVHGHEHDETSLPLLARQEDADLVVVGHSHRPAIHYLDGYVLLNPGSHADPRGNLPGHAELRSEEGTLTGRILTPDGEELETFSLSE